MSFNRYSDRVPFETLQGLTFKEVIRDGDEEIAFVTDGNETYKLMHFQDCCEAVEIDDIVGDLGDLIGSPIVRAEERESDENPREPHDAEYGTFTWTFYELATVKGSVTIRWYGSSNGYYSERVDLVLWRGAA